MCGCEVVLLAKPCAVLPLLMTEKKKTRFFFLKKRSWIEFFGVFFHLFVVVVEACSLLQVMSTFSFFLVSGLLFVLFFSLNCLKIVVDLFCLTGCAVFMGWLFGCLVRVTGKFLFVFVCVFLSWCLPCNPPDTYPPSTHPSRPPSPGSLWFCTFNQSCSSLSYYPTLDTLLDTNHSKCCAQTESVALCGRPLQADMGRGSVSVHANHLF